MDSISKRQRHAVISPIPPYGRIVHPAEDEPGSDPYSKPLPRLICPVFHPPPAPDPLRSPGLNMPLAARLDWSV